MRWAVSTSLTLPVRMTLLFATLICTVAVGAILRITSCNSALRCSASSMTTTTRSTLLLTSVRVTTARPGALPVISTLVGSFFIASVPTTPGESEIASLSGALVVIWITRVWPIPIISVRAESSMAGGGSFSCAEADVAPSETRTATSRARARKRGTRLVWCILSPLPD